MKVWIRELFYVGGFVFHVIWLQSNVFVLFFIFCRILSELLLVWRVICCRQPPTTVIDCNKWCSCHSQICPCWKLEYSSTRTLCSLLGPSWNVVPTLYGLQVHWFAVLSLLYLAKALLSFFFISYFSFGLLQQYKRQVLALISVVLEKTLWCARCGLKVNDVNCSFFCITVLALGMLKVLDYNSSLNHWLCVILSFVSESLRFFKDEFISLLLQCDRDVCALRVHIHLYWNQLHRLYWWLFIL